MNFKKVLLAAGLAMSMTAMPVMNAITPIFADDEPATDVGDGNQETTPTTPSYSITINETNSGHTFEAYQVFKGVLTGEQEADKEPELTNIHWGEGVDASGLLSALQANDKFGTGENNLFHGLAVTAEDDNGSAAKVAEIIGGNSFTSPQLKEFARVVGKHLSSTPTKSITQKDNAYSSTVSDPGYYFIKDKDNSLNEAEDEAYTSYILKVVGEASATPKKNTPTVDKSVWDNETEDIKGTDQYLEAADHDIMKPFNFRLTATIPLNDNIRAYDKYNIIFNDSMSGGVSFIELNSVTYSYDAPNALTETITANETTIVSIPEKGSSNASGSNLVWESTNLPEEGDSGSTFAMTVGDLKSAITSAPEGKENLFVTVEYKAQLNNNAIVSPESLGDDADVDDANNNNVYLQYSHNPNWDGTGDQFGKTPKDYVFVFTYNSENTKVNDAGEKLAGAEFQLEKDGQPILLVEVKDKNDKLLGYRPLANGETVASVASIITTETDNTVNFYGIDVGSYTIREINPPTGYTELAPVDFTISATHGDVDEKPTLTLMRTNADNTLVNTKNVTLPSTGGMGTTLLYGSGAVLVIGSLVFFITNRRVKGNR